MTYSQEIRAQALDAYIHSPDTASVIAANFGVSPSSLTQWAKSTGVPLRERGRNKADAPSEADRHRLELIAGGMTQEAVAMETGITKQRMSRIVHRWRPVLQAIKEELADRAAAGQASELPAAPPTLVHPVPAEDVAPPPARAILLTGRNGHRDDLTLADLDRLLCGRRTLPAQEKIVLLDRINVILREPPNTREVAEALLGIGGSATFMLFGGEWADFFHRVLRWPADEGLRILKLYADGRWAEAELQKANVETNGMKTDSEGDLLPVTSAQFQTAEKCASELASLTDTTGQEPVVASPGALAGAGEQGPPARDAAKPVAPSPNNGDKVATTANAAVNMVNENQAEDEKQAPLTGDPSPVTPQALPAVTLEANPTLSKKEMSLLSECEAVIEEKRQCIFELGEALRTIRDGKLYRQDYGSFEQYCRAKWDFTRSWAYFQLKAVNIRDNICQPMVDSGAMPEPSKERQIRPLAGLEPDQQRAAWKRAVELADGKEITGRLVQKAVREIKPASIPADNLVDAFNPDETWKGLEKLLLKRLALWPDHQHSDLRARLQGFMAERLPAVAVA